MRAVAKEIQNKLCLAVFVNECMEDSNFKIQGKAKSNWGRRLNVERQSATNVGRAHVEERRPPRLF